jgi:RNA polymerase sigma-70 factor (ECF subfamily)
MNSRQDQSEARIHADASLMQRVAANEAEAISELYDRFGTMVFRMAYQSLPSRSESEDAVQEIFIRLWRTSGKYDAHRAALVTWVMLISRRYLVDKLRRFKVRPRATSLDQPQAPVLPAAEEVESGRLDRDERMTRLMEKISGLPSLQQVVVKRAYLGGQTLRQIADETGNPLGTVKSALSRALVRLREHGSEESAR